MNLPTVLLFGSCGSHSQISSQLTMDLLLLVFGSSESYSKIGSQLTMDLPSFFLFKWEPQSDR
jgi:hypothetical protein